MAGEHTRAIETGRIALRPVEDSSRWRVDGDADWAHWVVLAQRILAEDALRRDLEARGDAWDQGHAAGTADAAGADTPNPYR